MPFGAEGKDPHWSSSLRTEVCGKTMLDQLVKDKITQEETHIRTGEESKDEELALMMPYEAL